MAGRMFVGLGLMTVLGGAGASELVHSHGTQAAVVDLWLAASLGLVLLYVRRRLYERRRARVQLRPRRR